MRQATAQQLADGSVLRLQHDGRHLYIGIAPMRPGFPSVCIVQNDSVRRPATLGATEGCTTTDLVRGYVPRGLMFTTADWAELRLGS